jgi:hypothetical protein
MKSTHLLSRRKLLKDVVGVGVLAAGAALEEAEPATTAELTTGPVQLPAPEQNQATEWTFERARQVWKPMTRAIQHVGVPGYQWQAGVLWDGSLFFGPKAWRDNQALLREVESLGSNLLHVAVGYGQPMRLVDRHGLGSPYTRQSLDHERLPIPHVETREGDLIWNEIVFGHLLGRKFEEGMMPEPQDVMVVHALFHVTNNGTTKMPAHLWLHFDDASQVKMGYKVAANNVFGRPLSHEFTAPFGTLEGKVRYVIPKLDRGDLVWHREVSAPAGMQNAAKRVIEWRVILDPGDEAEFRILVPFGTIDHGTANTVINLDSKVLLEKAREFWENLVNTPGSAIVTGDPYLTDYAAAVVGQMAAQIGYRHKARYWMYKTTPVHIEVYWPPCPALGLPTLDLRGLSQYSRPVLQSFIDTQSDVADELSRQRLQGKGERVRSEGFERRPGFLGNFGDWTANTLLLSQGLELYALAAHYRITRDNKWLGDGPGSPLNAILLACDWLAVQRRRTMREENGRKVPHWGLMPPAAAHDWLSGSTVFNDAYCLLGFIEAVRMLREIDHPRALGIRKELNDYRSCLKERYREARDRSRTIPLPDKREIPYVPREVTELDWADTDWTYTGYGPLRAGAWGAWDPNDELVDQALAFLESGMPKGRGQPCGSVETISGIPPRMLIFPM